ncbi:MAG: DUF3263 domain-containing protein [Acidimicrobiales bacterium]
MSLTMRERAILDFERSWWSEPGSKEQGIRRQLALSPTRYYELLGDLIETDDAVTYDPLVVRRVRRDREQRRRARWEGRPAGGSR